MAKEQVVKIGLSCGICNARNYVTTRNKINTPEKLKRNKFCNQCRQTTSHKEGEKLK